MWWHDLLWGFWNGITAWIVLIVHVFGGLGGQPVYDAARHQPSAPSLFIPSGHAPERRHRA